MYPTIRTLTTTPECDSPRHDSAITLVNEETQYLPKFWLVTGGAGFIGSHLVEALLNRGDLVRVLDNLSTGKLTNLPPSKRLEFVEGDICDPQTVHTCLDGVDGVFHLAAVASVQKSHEEWLNTHQTNLSATITIMNEIRHRALKCHSKPIPFVYASSAAVYGANQEVPLSETCSPMPLSAYGADKLSCEFQASVAGHVHDIPTCGFRFFNVYGPRQDPKSPYSGVISIFAHRMMNNQPITIFGDGEQSRDFVYVGDVVNALIRGMESGCTKAAPVYNVCTGNAITLNELVSILSDLINYSQQPNYEPPRAGDVRISYGSFSRLEQDLEWEPLYSVSVGLSKTLHSMHS